MNTDRQLLSAYLAGSERAFANFYQRHRRPVFVYLLSLLGTRDAAEDALQEVFATFVRQLEGGLLERPERPSGMRPCLLMIARSRGIDELRRRKRHERELEAASQRGRHDSLFDGGASLPGNGVALAEDLDAALRTLSREQREAVVLRALVELTFREIGELVGVPENTAVSRYRSGVQRIRARLAATPRDSLVGGRADTHGATDGTNAGAAWTDGAVP